MNTGKTSFTGRGQRRQTRRGVVLAERLAKALITIGGVGTILAVILILVFLAWVVLPLFASAKLTPTAGNQDGATAAPILCGLDPYGALSWTLSKDGIVEARKLEGGELLERRTLPAGEGHANLPEISARAVSVQGGEVALGFADGSVRLGRIGFAVQFFEPVARPDLVQALAGTQAVLHEHTLIQRTNEGQLRVSTLDLALEAPIDSGTTRPIVALDLVAGRKNAAVCLLDDRGQVLLENVSHTENMLTGEVSTEVQRATIPLDLSARPGLPSFLALTGSKDSLLLAWKDGKTLRYDVRKLEQPVLAEELQLCDAGARLEALTWLIGQTTLISGDSQGHIRGWFGIKPKLAHTADGQLFVKAHELPGVDSPVVALAASARNRVVASVHANGALRVMHVTSRKLLCATNAAAGAQPVALALAPKEDGLTLFTRSGSQTWRMDLEHPEAGIAALFTPVWYEGYEKPEHVWQSSGGTDDVEAKLGLVPLIFGTLKATFYSLLFGAPIALLAALFTSEFLDRRLRTPLKSLIELMASLPSVVLGFVAAIVIAPLIQDYVPAALALFITLPMTLLLAAYLWQLLPQKASVRLSGAPRFAAILLVTPLGALLALALGPLLERWLFAGDLMGWLDGRTGSAFGGWVFLLLPLAALAAALAASRIAGPWLRKRSVDWSRGHAARADLLRFGLIAAGAVLLAVLAGALLSAGGLDARGGVFDTYVQRNSLIVGFVMGFAVIPIIYTLAEDALSSVPQHLRHASLGAGATRWQTALRVVVPTAMSGIFSALMIGLGRAVGETMIVLMATGNTPVMSWNVFNGFRTLSANIAVELPEAVRNSTHYRTLFLAALCLFAITFVFNTLAEFVRQRFRKRAVQL